MSNDFQVDVIEPFGCRPMYGDVTFTQYVKIVQFSWNPLGVTIGKDSSELVIESESRVLSAHPESLIPWDKLTGHWTIRFPQSSSFAAGRVQHFDSLSKFLDYSDRLSERVILEGIRFLIPKTYMENKLSWELIQKMDGIAKRFGLPAVEAMNEILAPYRVHAALLAMLSQNPPKDAVSLLHASFKKY